MVDDMLEHLATLRSQPVWTPVPPESEAALRERLPQSAQGAEQVYAEFRQHVLPFTNGNRHPRFWGWVQGNGTPLGMMADMLAAGMNPHMAGFDQAPARVERQVLAWMAEIMGLPRAAGGLLVVGGTFANVLGLAIARQARAGFDVRALGLQASGQPRLRVYASRETHGWIDKGVELLGLGRASLCRVEVDDRQRVQVAALRQAIEDDRRAGLRPIAIVGTAGTVNTGAIDDLNALADLAREQALWLHVDGAFGALVSFSPRLRPLVAGLERADSLAFDMHKWMYLPFDVACLLVRAADQAPATFASAASYLTPAARGVIAGGLPFADAGLDLTRGFRALKVWMSLKAHGVDTFARLIEQNVEQAQALAASIAAQPELECLAPVALNVVCFRFRPPGWDRGDARLDALNEELLLRLQESGIAVLSSTRLAGRFALRCAITNHRSQAADFVVLLETVLALGRALVD
jgi:glutamate/tyrosine decarboxylase-like PLP-dependent enzyme